MPIMKIMIGLPRSGKSTISNRLHEQKGYTVVSRDTIREIEFGNKSNMDNEEEVTKIFNSQLTYSLERKENVVIDNCNVYYKARKPFYELAKKHGYSISLEVTIVSLEELILRAQADSFPEFVIYNMIKKNDIATLEIIDKNIHNEIYEINYSCTEFSMPDYSNFEQDNINHNENLADHMLTTSKIMSQISEKYVAQKNDIKIASELHDIGKLYTKEYSLEKNTYTYYGHSNISSFILLHKLLSESKQRKELSDGNILSLFLVHYHMSKYTGIPKILQNVMDSNQKYSKWLNILNLLHKADKYRINKSGRI
ncbi:MAG: AAA family ATPase [Fusobacteriaceae bacterium]